MIMKWAEDFSALLLLRWLVVKAGEGKECEHQKWQNQTAFAVRKLCSQFIFSNDIFVQRKTNLRGKKKKKKNSKAKKKKHFSSLLYLFTEIFIYLFIFFWITVWGYIYISCLVRLLNPFVFAVGSFLSALGLVYCIYCTGELKTKALVCDFLSI